jgi:hypothetical protein
MDVTPECLRENFQLLNDDELLNLFRSGDLTDLARDVAATELRRRGIDPHKPVEAAPDTAASDDTRDELDPDLWANSSGDLVLLERFFSLADGYVLQGRLAAEGVPALVADALAAQNIPWGPGALGGVRVLVPQSHIDRARKILRAVQAGEYALRDQPDSGEAG